jgi:class 3 adenylate cyclase/tetratricopeptide (TPR) repeat protein
MSNPALTNLLASYVPRLIQSRVVADPSPMEAPLVENIHAAVLFADISGFTRLTERLVERGPAGVETLARILNEYFGQLIDIIHEFGGDVVKFAGDALIAVWQIASDSPESFDPTPDKPVPVSRADQWQWTMRAAECALAIRQRLTNYKVEDASLYLKLAVSSGHITSAHVGGVFNRWEFLLTGNPLVEVGIANSLANASDIIITPSAWRLIRNDSIAEPVEFELKDAIAQGGRLRELDKPSSIFTSAPRIEIPSEVEGSLRAYIPGAIINRLTAGQSGWIAELRRVTVLFINLPGIDQNTPLADAQNLARLIQRSVYRYEGSINKINVDDKGITIVAALGLPPFAHEDDPARGVQAALMIRKELEALKVRSNIGVTSGRIFCGSIGNDTRREYTIIGNAVNLSARLMGAASKQDEIVAKYGVAILCDRVTFDESKDVVEFESLPPQQVKGRAEPVEAFHPLELKKSVIRPTTELIGRQEEKAIIANALQELSRGIPHHTIILHGESGIGKSRLFEDLVRQASTLRVNMYSGGGDPIERSTSYHAWRPIFNRIFKIEELISSIESAQEARAAIENMVTGKLNEIDPDLARYAPLLDVILPVPIPDNELTAAMVGEIRASNIREMLTRVLLREAQRAPLLIVMEDLHWFDSASWTLLVDVQQKVRPILMALNTRPLPDPAPVQFNQIVSAPETRLIKLEAMMLDDVESLVCQRLGVKSVPPMIGRLIREKSEGNPFFAEELAFALRESGALIVEDQECRVSSRLFNYEDLTLPDSLQAAITNRIDSLSPAHQLTLKVASVIGRVFAFRVLEAIHPIETDRQALPDYMNTLTRLSLTLIESETPDLAYIFKHAVTREVAYNLMLYSQRRQLHQAAAEWIEQNNADNLESYYPLLAHHWTQAAEIHDTSHNIHAMQKAVEFLDKAGEQAMQTYANKEAIQFFTQALDWDAKLPRAEGRGSARSRTLRRARWHSRIGLAQYALGSLVDCERHVREALKILGKSLPNTNMQFILGTLPQAVRQALHRFFPRRHLGSARGIEREAAIETGRLYELMSRMYFYSNQTAPIIYSALRSLNEAEKAGPTHELASAYAGMAVLTGFAQLHTLAESYVERALDVARAVNQPSTHITTNIVTCVYHMSVGKWEEVETRAQEARALCEKLGDFRQWADAITLVGEGAYLSGKIGSALNAQRTLLQDARRRNNPLHIIWGLAGVATDIIRLGQEAQGAPLFEEALQILEKLPNRSSSINAYAQLALAYQRLGWHDKSLAYGAESLTLAEGISPTNYSLLIGFSALAEVYFGYWDSLRASGKPDTDQFIISAEKALQLLRAYKNVFPIGQACWLYYKGWYEALTGTPESALKTWRTGLTAAEKYDQPFEEALLRMKLGISDSDPSTRADHFDRAISHLETMAALHELRLAREQAKRFR